MRILFICKKNETYGFKTMTRRSSGLYNSTRYIVESLEKRGVHAKIVEVTDNNDIDREVTLFKPHKVVIEALWVVPEKFDVLNQLHPDVLFYVHLHSHMPFLALEGIAVEWIRGYGLRDVGIIANSLESFHALAVMVHPGTELMYLPNVYLPNYDCESVPTRKETTFSREHDLHIGCFGAVRPMKNHLLQALAAIQYAKEMGKVLYFHINGTRSETNGDPVLKNLRSLFHGRVGTHLVEHPWYEPEEFHKLLKQLDIGLQVSMTETFNVVCADYVSAGLPLVASKEVVWVSDCSKALDNSVPSIVEHMRAAYRNRFLVWINRRKLVQYSKHAQSAWFRFAKARD